MKKAISDYWKFYGKTINDRTEGRVYGNDAEGYGCDECCNGDRCDDPHHVNRRNCSHCLGTGQNLTSIRLNNKMNEELKTSKEWYDPISNDLTIMDPDGWDRSNYDYSFNEEKISKEEFKRRVFMSTIIGGPKMSEALEKL